MTKKQTQSTATVAGYLASAPKAVKAYISDLEEQIGNLWQIG